MSIYATLWNIKLPIDKPSARAGAWEESWVEVFAQAVPGHIGHPSHYPEGDPYADFLPPVSADYDPYADTGTNRAVVLVQSGRDRKEGQRYVDPLLVLTGADYDSISFQVLLERIEQALEQKGR